MLKYIFLNIILIVLTQFRAFPQEKCGTVFLSKEKYGSNYPEKINRFEKWIKIKKSENKQLFTTSEVEIIQIPVVIHIVHKGELEGVNSNIPREQIISQLETLNEDFRRLNPDSVFTRNEFKPVAADTRIEFVLAKQDPNGFPTDGINRVQGPKDSYSLSSSDEISLKSTSYWPAEDYFNIWVTDLSFTLIGYAQFPVSSLPGLEDAKNERLTDGVVIDYEYFGTGFNTETASKGRTLTHEVGHFFGLRHIWGDGDCSATDYISDTPSQSSSTNGCPPNSFSCNSEDMFENYMDYTSDACMNIFTAEQASRMQLVLNESPRRKSLINSPGLIPPQIYDHDLRAGNINYPGLIHSETILVPEIEITNSGTNAASDFTIEVKVGNNIATFIPEEPINSGETKILSGFEIELQQSTDYLQEISINIKYDADQNTSNNSKSKSFYFHPYKIEVPFRERFEGPTNWLNISDNNQEWKYTNSVFTISGESSLVGTFASNTIGNPLIVTPVFDLTRTENASIFIDVSYRPSSSRVSDGLSVLISTNGGKSFDFDAATISASTLNAEPFRGDWEPVNQNDWKRIFVDLSEYTGNENVRLAFQGNNFQGNNFYFDNIELFLNNNSNPLFLNDPDIRVYPNPSINETNIAFYLDQTQDIEITLLNANGQVMEETKISNVLNQTYTQNLRSLSSGIYFIQIQGETFTLTKRIIRQ
ncbi:M43 family zinc metalloprotease [Marinigracilibium pacificum]|uniref:T9SS type A sorting domain-containing protein n=1 Tax=Marinigracilibium pacificum TaxID=2729599 RepID=A0A848J4M2_9BACT|nr:M43 family zinc metalloprotease [Marinigracilibium pacificum]NMM49299.1 T9SS type A sorting domain-containing protein [Marinigracilibium pacificum]